MLGFRKQQENGNWSDELRAVLPDGPEGDAVVAFVRDGTLDLSKIDVSRANPAYAQQHARSQVMHGMRQTVQDHLDAALATIDAMPDDAVVRFADVIGAGPGTHVMSRAVGVSQWLAALMARWSGDRTNRRLAMVEAVGRRVGFTAEDMVRVSFAPVQHRWEWDDISDFADFSNWTATHADLIRPYVAETSADAVTAWMLVVKTDIDTVRLFVDELAGATTATSKTLRQTVRSTVDRIGFDLLRPSLAARAVECPPATRALAVERLGELVSGGERPALVDWLTHHCGQDRSAGVRAAIAAIAAAGESHDADSKTADPEDTAEVVLPVLDFDESSDELLERLQPLVAQVMPREGFIEMLRSVFAGTGTRNAYFVAHQLSFLLQREPSLSTELTSVQVARVALEAPPHRWNPTTTTLIRQVGHPTPLELQAVAEHDGHDELRAAHVVIGALDANAERVWTHDEIEPWVRRQLPELLRFLRGDREGSDSREVSRSGLFYALACLPDRPTILVDALVDCGIHGHQPDRGPARRALGPDVLERVVPFLAASKVADRVAAATWLRELRDPAAQAPLRTAIEREKQDLAKAQLLGALEACGGSLDEYLAPDKLLAEARIALAKKNAIPAALAWLSLESLPEVRWRDGTIVDRSILQFFVATAVKAKTAEPSPMLRRYAELMEPEDVRRFGEALFESWVTEDLKPRPHDECVELARTQATWKLKYANRGATMEGLERYQGLTIEQAILLELPAFQVEPAGSAVDSKGVLAVVAAMGGPELVPRVHAFLKKWRGRRLSQGKAMLQMLAWMESPPAIQVVLTVGQRFRPRGLQDEANKQAALLAERRGWTVEDLADRTVPRGGFDDDGRLDIDYGDRKFVAHLRDDLSVELTSAETGKTIKSLPAARLGEDETDVKDLQKDLAAAKKEIKSTATLQPDRLFQAMCLQRSWAADDFVRYIVNHPVMRRLAQRLVWQAAAGDTTFLFRPTSDGSFIDLDDEEVELAEDAAVAIAHDELVDAAAASQWLAHLADYDVTPLFPQFQRPAVSTELDGAVIRDFEGHVLSTLTLKGLMNKLGWQTAPAGDGGWIDAIHKDFVGGELRAVLTFTGMPAYNEDRPAALISLYFSAPTAWASETAARPLRQVPPILLREIYGEVQAIAAAGSGFDPDWERTRP